MGDDEAKADNRFGYIRERIGNAFPKLVGPKLDKLLLTDEIKELCMRFCDEADFRCLVVPESMKLDTVIPSKIGKGKVLLLIKLVAGPVKLDDMPQNVSFLPGLPMLLLFSLKSVGLFPPSPLMFRLILTLFLFPLVPYRSSRPKWVVLHRSST